MSQLSVKHNGFEITYSENEDVWRCWQADVQSPKLSVVKQKLNNIIAADRRLDAVPVIVLGYDDTPVEGVATLLVGEKGVWVKRMRRVYGTYSRGRNELGRVKEGLDNVILDTPENRALIAEFVRLHEAARNATDAARAAKRAIPRATREQLLKLKMKTDEAPA